MTELERLQELKNSKLTKQQQLERLRQKLLDEKHALELLKAMYTIPKLMLL
jgi:hypothetical protein